MRYGDAVYEVSTSGELSIAIGWDSDNSSFIHLISPFFVRGGDCGDTSGAGMFTFEVTSSIPYFLHGFRAVVCPL